MPVRYRIQPYQTLICANLEAIYLSQLSMKQEKRENIKKVMKAEKECKKCCSYNWLYSASFTEHNKHTLFF